MRGYVPQLTRVELSKLNDDDGEQIVDYLGYAGEQHTEVLRVQTHGFTSVPVKGSHGLLLRLGGEGSRGVVLGLEDNSLRPKGNKPGTSHLYDDKGNIISVLGDKGVLHKTAKGDWQVKTDQGKITMNSKGDVNVETEADVWLGGAVGDGQKVLTVSGPSKNVYAKV